MKWHNVLIYVHGMTQEKEPGNHQKQYDRFFQKMCSTKPELRKNIDKHIYVEWGHEPERAQKLRPDQRITGAETTIHQLAAYKKVRRIKDNNNRVICDFTVTSAVGLQYLFTRIREKTVIFGLGDVVYYCGEDGEAAVRETVYGQVLNQLASLKNKNVRLHIIAHSIGCTVAFDFLYGLFAPSANWKNKKPDFCQNKKYGETFLKWRKKQERGQLVLGSMTSMASQLPILLLRKQKVVDIFRNNKRLSPSSIGIKDTKLRWKIYYDIDDLLAFPTRNLFDPNTGIMDIQVRAGMLPNTAHSGYWKCPTVIKEAASLLAGNVN